jgi:hypothetical protein
MVGGILCVTLLLWALSGYYWNPVYAKIDSREAARIITAGEQPGDVIVLSFSANAGALRCYYQGKLQVISLNWRRRAELPLEARLQAIVAAHRRVWLVAPHPWMPRHHGGVPPRLAAAYTVVTHWDMAGVRVMLLTQTPA